MDKKHIGIEDAVRVDNQIWFCLSDYKSLVSMDIETKEQKAFTIPSDGPYMQKRAFGSMYAVGRKVYLIPFYERVIMQFDIDAEEFHRIGIDESIIEDKTHLFLGVGVYQNYLFIMGVDVPAILRLNTFNNNIDYVMDWKEKVKNLIFDSSDAYFRKQAVVIDNKLYVPFCNANAVLELNCTDLETEIHCMGAEKQGYSGICYDGSAFWLSPRNVGAVVKWEVRTHKISKMRDLVTAPYVGIIFINGKKIMLPMVEKQIYMSNITENIFELCGVCSFVQEDMKNILFYEPQKGWLTWIDKEGNKQLGVEVGGFTPDIDAIFREKWNVVEETREMGIHQFVEKVMA